MKKLRLLLLFILAIGITGCNVSGDVLDLSSKNSSSSSSNRGTMIGLVPGAANQTTSGGYKIYSSVGDTFSSLKQTTGGGYTVYSNIEGNL